VGDVTITNTVVSGNSTDQQGGGVFGYNVGNVAIDSSTFDQNTAVRDGGGLSLYEVGDVTITNTVVSGNTAGQGGGGVLAKYVGDVLIDSSTFDQNTSSRDGGGLYATYTDSFTMTNSTVSGNQALDGAGLEVAYNGNVLIANSTIANNVGDPSIGDGGALYSWGSSGNIRILFSTISGNSGKRNIVRLNQLNGYEVDLTGTIISDNTTVEGSGTEAVDLYLYGRPSSVLTVSSSLIMGTTGGDPFTDGGGNVFGVSAQLGALADNGGATFTMEPATSSPVIDAGPLTWTAFPGDGSDQRGGLFLRVYNGQSDMGSIETQPEPVPPTTTTTSPSEPVAPAFTG
jgi:predicted outer membrane repeat protein